MDPTLHLTAKDAVLKLRALVEAAPTCMFGTKLTEIPFHVCPMHAQQVDDNGSIWFMSGMDSEHAAHIATDPRVHILFSNPSAYEFLTVYGEAVQLHNEAKIDELWSPFVKAWFPGGKQDSNLTLIRVDPHKAHFWDTKDGKLVVLAKILVSAITGRVEDGGVEGDLEVH